MMNDDDKKNNNGTADSSELGGENANNEGEKPKQEAIIIPFDPNFQVQQTVDATKAKLDEAAVDFKTLVDDLREQLRPVGNFLHEFGKSFSANTSEMIKDLKAAAHTADDSVNKEDKLENGNDAANPDDAPNSADNSETENTKEISEEVSGALEASRAIKAAIEQIRDRTANAAHNLNVKSIVAKEFAKFADENLSKDDYTVDENGNRKVVIDGPFLSRYGAEAVPAMLRGTLNSLFNVFVGPTLSSIADNKTNSGASDTSSETYGIDESEASESATEDIEEPTNKYDVKFNLANSISDFMRDAKVSAVNLDDEEINVSDDPDMEEKMDRGREIIIETSRIFEDAINGKDIGNTEERLLKAAERAEVSDEELDPDEINAIDEKHRMILELSKEYEKAMHHKDDDDDDDDD